MKNEDIKKLIKEALEEVGPRTAAKALDTSEEPNSNYYGQTKDERGSQLLKDSVTSLFSEYIGRDFPFLIKIEGAIGKYELIEIEPFHEDENEFKVYFYFYNNKAKEGEKEISFVYSTLQDKVAIQRKDDYSVNMFTANFFVKSANKIREMFYTAFPGNLEGDIKSNMKKQDFNMFISDSNNMMNMNESKVVKITKDQLQQIIKEGVDKLHRKTLIENRIRKINEELGVMSEIEDESKYDVDLTGMSLDYPKKVASYFLIKAIEKGFDHDEYEGEYIKLSTELKVKYIENGVEVIYPLSVSVTYNWIEEQDPEGGFAGYVNPQFYSYLDAGDSFMENHDEIVEMEFDLDDLEVPKKAEEYLSDLVRSIGRENSEPDSFSSLGMSWNDFM